MTSLPSVDSLQCFDGVTQRSGWSRPNHRLPIILHSLHVST